MPISRQHGVQIGQYRLIGRLGRGQQSTVHRAQNLETGEIVALKIVRDGQLASMNDRLRFEEEIRISSQLSHRNIAKMKDHGSPDSMQFMALEYIDGCDLSVWISLNTGDNQEAVQKRIRAFVSICDAIGFAHSIGVIHRDLKPNNILMDSEDVPHLIDFGLAKQDSAAVRYAQSSPGGFIGTPDFASPEQINSGPSDARSDIFSLGIILYMLACEEHLYEGVSETSKKEFWAGHIDLPSALERSSSIDSELDKIIRKSIAHNPDDRYQSADELAVDVTRYLENSPVSASPPAPKVPRNARNTRRFPAIVASSAFLLVVLAMAIRISGAKEHDIEHLIRTAHESARKGEVNEFIAAASIVRASMFEEINLAKTPGQVTRALNNLEAITSSFRLIESLSGSERWFRDSPPPPSIAGLVTYTFELHVPALNEEQLKLFMSIRNDLILLESNPPQILLARAKTMFEDWQSQPAFASIRNKLPDFYSLIQRLAKFNRVEAGSSLPTETVAITPGRPEDCRGTQSDTLRQHIPFSMGEMCNLSRQSLGSRRLPDLVAAADPLHRAWRRIRLPRQPQKPIT